MFSFSLVLSAKISHGAFNGPLCVENQQVWVNCTPPARPRQREGVSPHARTQTTPRSLLSAGRDVSGCSLSSLRPLTGHSNTSLSEHLAAERMFLSLSCFLVDCRSILQWWGRWYFVAEIGHSAVCAVCPADTALLQREWHNLPKAPFTLTSIHLIASICIELEISKDNCAVCWLHLVKPAVHLPSILMSASYLHHCLAPNHFQDLPTSLCAIGQGQMHNLSISGELNQRHQNKNI